MSFCNNTTPTPMTVAQLNAGYSPNPLLPSPMPAIDANGFVAQATLDSIVDSLAASGRIPRPPPIQDTSSVPFDSPDSVDPLNSYTAAEAALHTAIKAEYCYYEKAYLSALDAFLGSLASSSLNQQAGLAVQSNLALAQETNKRLTVFTQIVNAIAKKRYTVSTSFNNMINTMNGGFQARGNALAEQAKILNKESAGADVHKRMAEYTMEKNKANNNLLTMYALLNISAIAMLIYISRT